jgi:hypothetical protein
MKIHPSITEERLMDAVRRRTTNLDDPGLCIGCGHEQGGCEPDARAYECEVCGEPAVYGAEELFMRLARAQAVLARALRFP